MRHGKQALAGFIMLFISISPVWAAHPACGCSPYPAEGIYGTSEPLTLSYVDGTAETCPTLLRLQARREGAPDVDVTLNCNGPGQTWTGIEMSPFGSFVYSLLPQRPSPGAGGKLSDAATDFTVKINFKIKLPELLYGFGKKDRTSTMDLQGKGKPPSCICNSIREELAFLKEMQALFLDESIIEAAEYAGLRGSNNNATMWMDGQRKLHNFNERAEKTISYNDLVSGIYNEEISVDSSGIQLKKGSRSEAVEKATDYSFGEKNERAFAATHPNSCKITPPKPSAVHNSCSPSIVVDAMLLHEQQHVKKCKSFNSPPTYIAPDGNRYDWMSGRDSFTGEVQFKRVSFPRSGYSAWIQSVKNNAKDEADAYAVEMRVLSKYLSTNCD